MKIAQESFLEKIVLQPSFTPPKTEVYFGLSRLQDFCRRGQGVILVDSALTNTHGAAIQKRIGYDLLAVQHKTREAKLALEDELFKRKLGKESVILAVGGGMTTDLAGFLASTYMRGVDLVLIPTTLLGMVDAAIGGKTGIDTPFGKNSVGTFYLPKAVFIEPAFLQTLPEKEKKNGLSEILKYGLIANRSIWEKGANWERELEFLIPASIACKIEVVTQDFEEKTGLRHILNFGHTVGHALELLSHFQMAHGEAVALGCMAESYLSYLEGYLSKADLEEILSLYQKLGYTFKKVEKKALFEAMQRDKKAKGGEPRFVLIDQIGHCVPFDGDCCTTVTHLDEMVEWVNGMV